MYMDPREVPSAPAGVGVGVPAAARTAAISDPADSVPDLTLYIIASKDSFNPAKLTQKWNQRYLEQVAAPRPKDAPKTTTPQGHTAPADAAKKEQPAAPAARSPATTPALPAKPPLPVAPVAAAAPQQQWSYAAVPTATTIQASPAPAVPALHIGGGGSLMQVDYWAAMPRTPHHHHTGWPQQQQQTALLPHYSGAMVQHDYYRQPHQLQHTTQVATVEPASLALEAQLRSEARRLKQVFQNQAGYQFQIDPSTADIHTVRTCVDLWKRQEQEISYVQHRSRNYAMWGEVADVTLAMLDINPKSFGLQTVSEQFKHEVNSMGSSMASEFQHSVSHFVPDPSSALQNSFMLIVFGVVAKAVASRDDPAVTHAVDKRKGLKSRAKKVAAGEATAAPINLIRLLVGAKQGVGGGAGGGVLNGGLSGMLGNVMGMFGGFFGGRKKADGGGDAKKDDGGTSDPDTDDERPPAKSGRGRREAAGATAAAWQTGRAPSPRSPLPPEPGPLHRSDDWEEDAGEPPDRRPRSESEHSDGGDFPDDSSQEGQGYRSDSETRGLPAHTAVPRRTRSPSPSRRNAEDWWQRHPGHGAFEGDDDDDRRHHARSPRADPGGRAGQGFLDSGGGTLHQEYHSDTTAAVSARTRSRGRGPAEAPAQSEAEAGRRRAASSPAPAASASASPGAPAAPSAPDDD